MILEYLLCQLAAESAGLESDRARVESDERSNTKHVQRPQALRGGIE